VRDEKGIMGSFGYSEPGPDADCQRIAAVYEIPKRKSINIYIEETEQEA